MTIFSYTKYFPPHQPPNRNGVIKATHGLAAALADYGESVAVLSEGEESATIQTQFGYTHYCFDNPQAAPSFKLAPNLQQFVEQNMTPHDVVILNGGFHLSVYALAQLLTRKGIPYIMAPHLAYDHQMFAKSPCLKYLYWHFCERWVLQQARVIQVFDHTQTKCLLGRGITSPIIEVYNGCDPIGDPSPLIATSTLSPKLMFFGRLSAHTKGLDLLLDAFALLQQQLALDPSTLSYPISPTLTLQGADHGDRQTLQQQIQQLNLAAQVNLVDADYETSPMVLMANYDIICLPSRSEGFGLAALEAMLAGRVLLVSETAGIAQHVRASGCGVVVKPDVESIQTGLQWLLQRRDEWPDMGMRGYHYACAKLSWRRIAQQALTSYQRLIPEWEPAKQRSLVKLPI
jgi:glycosyltransferase involved in cell wall biosynthesis